MLTEEQKTARMHSIGGSDIAIILGLSKYKTPYELYLEKKGLLSGDHDESSVQYWGNRLESVVRNEFALRNDVTVDTPDTITHPFYDYMRGNLDGFIAEHNAVLEIKCSTQFMAQEWGEQGSDTIPMSYLCQVAYYCALTNADKAYIAVLIGGHDYREFCYMRDTQLEFHVIKAAADFWECIQNDEPPATATIADCRLKFPSSNSGETVTITTEIKERLDKLRDLKKAQKSLDNNEEEMKMAIIEYMQNAEAIVDALGKPLVTYKSNKKGARSFLIKGEGNE